MRDDLNKLPGTKLGRRYARMKGGGGKAQADLYGKLQADTVGKSFDAPFKADDVGEFTDGRKTESVTRKLIDETFNMRGWWLSPDAKLTKLRADDWHQGWASDYLDAKGIEYGDEENAVPILFSKGWVRLMKEGDTLWVHNKSNRWSALTPRQQRAITALSQESEAQPEMVRELLQMR